jgi:hypothetical protein
MRLEDLKHRHDLGKWLTERGLLGSGAEIGVLHGAFSEIVLNDWNGDDYWMIDIWRPQSPKVYRERTEGIDYTAAFVEASQRTRRFPQAHILRADSPRIAKQFQDNSLDFVYIDANHELQAVLDDLEAWYPKVKPGGLFSGHDYVNDTNWQKFCQVKDAVDFWNKDRHRIHTTPCESWWMIKP